VRARAGRGGASAARLLERKGVGRGVVAARVDDEQRLGHRRGGAAAAGAAATRAAARAAAALAALALAVEVERIVPRYGGLAAQLVLGEVDRRDARQHLLRLQSRDRREGGGRGEGGVG